MKIEEWRTRLIDGSPLGAVSVEMAQSNLPNGAALKKAVEITMADGSQVYGCVWGGCEYLGAHPTNVSVKHWTEHETRAPRTYIRKEDYGTWTWERLTAALREADAKVKRAEAARDRAVEQVATVKETMKDTIASLREQLAQAEKDLEAVRGAAKLLFPGMAG